jgi:hypothetical protein
VAWWEMAGGRQAAPATGACLCVAMVNLGGKKGMGRKKTVVDLGWSHWVRYQQRYATCSTLVAHRTAAPGDGKANGMCRSRPASPKCSAFPCVRYARAAPTSRTEQPPRARSRKQLRHAGTTPRRR